MNEQLLKPCTMEKVSLVVAQMGGLKAPGPNGYIALFFKSAWSIVGEDVTKAVQFFFQTNILYIAFNATIVALVPKCSNPNNMRDFRPISCCSVVYKCITKILANRLQKHLPCLIGKNQSAFTKGRSILDNIFMA